MKSIFFSLLTCLTLASFTVQKNESLSTKNSIDIEFATSNCFPKDYIIKGSGLIERSESLNSLEDLSDDHKKYMTKLAKSHDTNYIFVDFLNIIHPEKEVPGILYVYAMEKKG